MRGTIIASHELGPFHLPGVECGYRKYSSVSVLTFESLTRAVLGGLLCNGGIDEGRVCSRRINKLADWVNERIMFVSQDLV